MIKDIVNSDDFTLSFELFPPRHDDTEERYKDVVARCTEIIKMKPAYISVTHRAGNTFDETFKICMLAKSYGIPVVAHMRARDTSFDEARIWANCCLEQGIAIMPVTGDEYKGPVKNIDGLTIAVESTDKGCFNNSTDLTKFLSNIEGLEVLGTWYPETTHGDHNDTVRKKYESGVEVFISQMVFNTDYYFPYAFENYQAAFVPGILPILSEKSYVKCAKDVQIPSDFYKFASFLSVANGDAGIAYATYEIKLLKMRGLNHVHLFTMDNINATRAIRKAFNE